MPAFYSMTGAAIITFCALVLFPLFLVKLVMFSSTYLLPLLGLFYVANSSPPKVDLSWHPPKKTQINDLNAVIHGTGVFGGYIFNSSQDPSGVSYGTYNWCNMPHVRKEEYIIPPKEYQLEYVELVILAISVKSRHRLLCKGNVRVIRIQSNLPTTDPQTSQAHTVRCKHLPPRVLLLGLLGRRPLLLRGAPQPLRQQVLSNILVRLHHLNQSIRPARFQWDMSIPTNHAWWPGRLPPTRPRPLQCLPQPPPFPPLNGQFSNLLPRDQ